MHSHPRTSSCVCTYTHGSSVPTRCLHMCRFSPSRLLPSYVPLILAVLARSLRDHSRLTTSLTIPSTRPCRTFPSWKRRPCATPHLHREVWLPGQVRSKHRLWAQRVRQDHFRGWWHDAHQRSEPQFLRCLENHEREHWTIRCSHSVWILCFARFSKVILLFKWKAKKACIGKPVARRREWEEREGFAIRVA